MTNDQPVHASLKHQAAILRQDPSTSNSYQDSDAVFDFLNNWYHFDIE